MSDVTEKRRAVERQLAEIKSGLDSRRTRTVNGREWLWVLSAAAVGLTVGLGTRRLSNRR